MLTETWIEKNNKFNLYKLNEFNSIICSRNTKCCDKKSGGGILIYINNKYNYNVIFMKSEKYCEIVGFELLLNNTNPVIFICIYRPPNSDLMKFLKDLELIFEKFHDRKIILGGDLNIDLLSHDSKTLQYTDLLNCFNINISNKAITRNANKTITDHVLTLNMNNEIQSITAEKSSISDHKMIISLIGASRKLNTIKSCVTIKKFDYQLMREKFLINMQSFIDKDSDSMTRDLIHAIHESMKHSSYTRTYKVKSNECVPVWANDTFFQLSKRISNIEKKICKLSSHGKSTDKLSRIQQSVKDKLNKFNVSRAQKYYTELIRENPNRTWLVVNRVLGREKKSDTKITLNINDLLISDKRVVAETLADFFESNLTLSDNPISLNFIGQQNNECMFFEMVTYEEVYATIMALDSKKATGSDGKPGKVIKELANEIVIPLTELINKIVISSVYPQQFKEANIIPIHKGGDKTSKDNYRGISLLPILNKVMEIILLSRINSFIRHIKLEDNTQYGFKKGIGTNDAIFKFLHEIISGLDDNKICIVVFVDLKKAFDFVNHEVLLFKLDKIGIKGVTHDLLKSYLNNRLFSVKNEDAISSKKGIKKGVPQGGAASPTLFNINQVDMQHLNLSSKTVKYADDLLLFKNVDKEELEEGMKEIANDLILINNYYNDNGLSINFKKTSFMLLRNSLKDKMPESICLNDTTTISIVKEQKYLRIILDENLNFKQQFETLIDKLTDTLKALRIIRNYLPIDALLKFFHAHFMSHLYYCAFIYAKMTKEELKRLQRLQNWCIKAIFRLDSTHETADLYKNYMRNTLPVIGVIYFSMIVNIKKSLLTGSDLFPKFEVTESNTRSNGSLRLKRFKRKNRVGIESGYLGVKLFNQLPEEIKATNKLKKFKCQLKKHLINEIELLLSDDQLKSRKICRESN